MDWRGPTPFNNRKTPTEKNANVEMDWSATTTPKSTKGVPRYSIGWREGPQRSTGLEGLYNVQKQSKHIGGSTTLKWVGGVPQRSTYWRGGAGPMLGWLRGAMAV